MSNCKLFSQSNYKYFFFYDSGEWDGGAHMTHLPLTKKLAYHNFLKKLINFLKKNQWNNAKMSKYWSIWASNNMFCTLFKANLLVRELTRNYTIWKSYDRKRVHVAIWSNKLWRAISDSIRVQLKRLQNWAHWKDETNGIKYISMRCFSQKLW